jgi:hypothetical protein
MSTRIYLPTTLADLASYVENGGVGPGPLTAYAVTDELRTGWPDGSDEEWEYAALSEAADACTGSRRVVLVADVPAATRADPDDATAVTVDAFPMRLVAAVHADLTDADAQADQELCWFAAQEIPDLLRSGA